MKITRAPLLPLFVILTALGSFQNAEGQWASLKAALQADVKILEETQTRLILCREDSAATLVIGIKKNAETDIFGGLEAKRGGNPYRVWITTENFWHKPHLAEEGGKNFFRSSFVKTLRSETAPKILAPAELPPETEKEPAIEEPYSVESLAEPTPPEEPVVENITTENTAADSLRDQAEEAVSPRAVQPARPRNPARGSPKARRPRKSEQRATGAAPLPADKMPQTAPTPPPPMAAAVARAATLDSLYQKALMEIEKANWKEAVVRLEDIQLLQPNYRDVADQLVQARINQDLAQKRSLQASSRKGGAPALFASGALAAIGAFVALIVLPMLGVIFLSTGLRARYYLIRGHHTEAARLYEKKLERRPGKTKLYAELANAYLLLGRRDEQALKVYKLVLQLQVNTKNREALNAIVAQSYLAESRNDANMIEVLENALKAERKKLGQGPAPEKP